MTILAKDLVLHIKYYGLLRNCHFAAFNKKKFNIICNLFQSKQSFQSSLHKALQSNVSSTHACPTFRKDKCKYDQSCR